MDCQVEQLSYESRFDIAYRCIMQLALVALLINGYRPDTNRPGHHMTMLQTLPKTMGISPEQLLILDTFRRKRNLLDYTGEDIDEVTLQECQFAANELLGLVESWLSKNRKGLLNNSD